LKKKKGSPATAGATAATSSNQKKQQTKYQRGEFTSRVGRQRSEEDDEDDDIFEREAKSDAKEKEDANLAYQRMMSTMKSESSTSRAVNTNKALDSSSEDELENAIQKAVLGSKAKKESSMSSPLKPTPSPRSPNESKSQSVSGSPSRSVSKASISNPPSKQQQQQPAARQTKTYQPKNPSTNFNMFSVGAKRGGRPSVLRGTGSDSDLDDASSNAGARRQRNHPKSSDDDDFYG